LPPIAGVRNGKPPIDTEGRDGRCACVWMRAATAWSAATTATRSRTTSSATTTTARMTRRRTRSAQQDAAGDVRDRPGEHDRQQYAERGERGQPSFVRRRSLREYGVDGDVGDDGEYGGDDGEPQPDAGAERRRAGAIDRADANRRENAGGHAEQAAPAPRHDRRARGREVGEPADRERHPGT